jgi:anti-anti-sigma factor
MVIELAGEIDLVNARDLGDRICRAIDGSRHEIVIDLSAVPFIDSSAGHKKICYPRPVGSLP